MPSDKDIKKEFKLEASKNPDKYYATSVLKAEGFSRKQCACGTFFWSVNADQKTCGDPVCSGGFRFIGEKAKDASETGLDYVGVWKKFAAMFKDAGYTPIPRYPVVARWRDDTDFVQASIYDFQPYVVSGEVEPPANPLVVPQFCLRFNDIDNVGITGAHYTGFDMIGQHAFLPPEQWSQPRFFGDIHKWLKNGLGLPNEEITFHEDAWAGGGNFGPCMEYFSKGMELGNQVYMMYEVTAAGPRELKLKVLDMGMGHERNAWFAAGAQTSYESTFPTVMASLRARTGVKADPHFRRQFLPLASFLNLDETDDINKQWQMVADKLKMDITEVKEKALSDAALYSVAEHSRALLVALADGALPSNVGGGYNLRTILRRALDFIEQRSWDIDLADVAEQHARYLKPLYPELVENLENVKTILAVEKRKHQETRSRAGGLVRKALAAGISTDKMVELYDSHGIMPSEVVREARAQDLKLAVPDNFFSLVAERHEQAEQATATVKAEGLDLEGIPGTDALYLGDWQEVSSEGVVLKVIGTDVVLDKTAAYPTSGGQLHDVGMLEGPDSGTYEILDVFKQGACIVHRLSEAPKLAAGDAVRVSLDLDRRRQLAQHHTATHLIGAAARKVLGSHINQAGARKTLEKATLDITHYQNVSDEEKKAIETEANLLVKQDIPVVKSLLARNDAEKRYGMRIYQGGAVPGRQIRIVEIQGVDIQACGGTHLNHTGEVGTIRIIRSSKVQDGVVRLEFVAGAAREAVASEAGGILEEAVAILGCPPAQVPGRTAELFTKWKQIVKKGRKDIDATLVSVEETSGDILKATADVLKTQPEHIPKTLRRFLAEIEVAKDNADAVQAAQ